jgi:hypothetical protein
LSRRSDKLDATRYDWLLRPRAWKRSPSTTRPPPPGKQDESSRQAAQRRTRTGSGVLRASEAREGSWINRHSIRGPRSPVRWPSTWPAVSRTGGVMRRIADLYPRRGKTDARDAFVIADAARTVPHTLRRVGTDDGETLAGLGVPRELRRRPGSPVDSTHQPTRDACLHDPSGSGTAAGRARPDPRRRRPMCTRHHSHPPRPCSSELGAGSIAAGPSCDRGPHDWQDPPSQDHHRPHGPDGDCVPGTSGFGRVIARRRRPAARRPHQTHCTGCRPPRPAWRPPSLRVLTSMPGDRCVRTALGDPSPSSETAPAFPTAGHRRLRGPGPSHATAPGTSVKGRDRSRRGHHALKAPCSCRHSPPVSADHQPAATTTAKLDAGKRHNTQPSSASPTRRRVGVGLRHAPRPPAPTSRPVTHQTESAASRRPAATIEHPARPPPPPIPPPAAAHSRRSRRPRRRPPAPSSAAQPLPPSGGSRPPAAPAMV